MKIYNLKGGPVFGGLTNMLSAIVNSKGELSTESSNGIVPWWSFTKTLLAYCSLKLVEKAKLDLDSPIENKSYTLRQLLQHRAGISDYGQIAEYHEAVERGDDPWTRQELISRISFNSDQRFMYSNVGYLLVRELIEKCVGSPLSTCLKELVFEPLDLRSARIAETTQDLNDLDLETTNDYNPNWVYHGLAIGSVADSALGLYRILSGDYLREDLLKEMMTGIPLEYKRPIRQWTETGYGLGLMIGKIQGEDSNESTLGIGHTGGGPGSFGAIYQFPELESKATVSVFGSFDNAVVAERTALEIAS